MHLFLSVGVSFRQIMRQMKLLIVEILNQSKSQQW